MRKGATMSSHVMTIAALAIVTTSAPAAAPPVRDTHLKTAKMSFAAAMKPYAAHAYRQSGYVDRDGRINGGGLGCSALHSVVLHPLRNRHPSLHSFQHPIYP